jgi:rhomboid protease GluP
MPDKAAMTLLAILIVGGLALYVMNDTERARIVQTVLGALGHAKRSAEKARARRDPFTDALRARTPLVVVTPAIAVAHLVVFLLMSAASGPVDSPDTLIAWGANFGPRTTNGDWLRLIGAPFVHAGVLELLVVTISIVSVGLVLERLAGAVAFISVYAAAAVLTGVVSLSASPMNVSHGAFGAVAGLYGVLVAAVLWGLLPDSKLKFPLHVLKSLAIPAAVFLLYSIVSGAVVASAELAGFAMGFASGLVLMRRIDATTPPARLVFTTLATTLVVAAVAGLFLRGMADVRPEIARIVALEERTAALYRKAVDQFRIGALNAKALATTIDRAIMPEVVAERARLKAIRGVPREHQPLVANADEYLRLREESWRQRSQALQSANMAALRQADRTEYESLEALEKIKPAAER